MPSKSTGLYYRLRYRNHLYLIYSTPSYCRQAYTTACGIVTASPVNFAFQTSSRQAYTTACGIVTRVFESEFERGLGRQAYTTACGIVTTNMQLSRYSTTGRQAYTTACGIPNFQGCDDWSQPSISYFHYADQLGLYFFLQKCQKAIA